MNIGSYPKHPDDKSEIIQIQEKKFHPSFENRDNYYSNDIMLIKLKESSTKPYVKLRREIPSAQARLTTIGLGVLNSLASLAPSRLQEVELGYIENDKCQEIYGSNALISEDMLCAKEPQKDAWSVLQYLIFLKTIDDLSLLTLFVAFFLSF